MVRATVEYVFIHYAIGHSWLQQWKTKLPDILSRDSLVYLCLVFCCYQQVRDIF